MSDFRFAEPQWVHAIWGVLLLVGALVLLELRSGRSLDAFVGRLLQPRLAARAPRRRRLARIGLLGLSGVALVLALMRPQLGLTFVSTPKAGAEIFFCLDVSRSMLAEDVVPNRLERAKDEIEQLLPLLDGDQVGLIAFAGRASIICPLTPDLSFFRLVLDEVSANSVGRGGTRLEEPLRKAVDAFGLREDASKMIIMITDGEDHDSFVEEAAVLVKERGVRFLAIGIGDEAGSPIEITDPRTGAREPLRDGNGAPVRSRLDGETLRAIATECEGRYILAGTRALDLEDIYERSIEPMMRSSSESGGRSIRQEAYQWPALLSLLALFAAALVTGRPRPPLATIAGLLLLLPGPALAQDATTVGGGEESPPRLSAPEENEGAEGGVAGSAAESEPPPPSAAAEAGRVEPELTPRELHNGALEALQEGDLEAARALFERAEEASGLDALLRYRCRYHLGWLHVEEANRLLGGEEAEGAIEELEAAANRFRDALRVRPEGEEARHNLEVVLRRIRELRDSLRAEEEETLEGRLDGLIERQRELLAEIRSLIDGEVANPDASLDERARRRYRAMSVVELQLLSDLGVLAGDAEEERRSIEGTPEEERTPEQEVRRNRIERLVEHLTRAQERLGQARRTLRRQQGERGARRASLGLSALKRAREQLREPLEVLDWILPDARSLLEQGTLLAVSSLPDLTGERPPLPAWIGAESLGEESTEIGERVGELADIFRGAASADAPPPDPADPEAAQRERAIAMVREALPSLDSATAAFEEAAVEFPAERAREGARATGRGVAALMEARELFLDAKGLIELLWQSESAVLQALRGEEGDDRESRLALLPEARALHEKAEARLGRLRSFIEEEAAEVEEMRAAVDAADPAAPPAEGAPTEEQVTRMEERIDLVQRLLEEVERTTSTARATFDEEAEREESEIDLDRIAADLDRVLPPLELLRRIYFTLIEHLRDLTRRQQELNDRTADGIALARGTPEEAGRHLIPLRRDQEELRAIATELAPAVREQGEQMPESDGASPPGGAPGAGGGPGRAEWLRAAELIESAAGEQGTALSSLFTEPPEGESFPLDAGEAAQQAALEQLAEALFLLDPPPETDPGEDSGEEQPSEASAGEEGRPEGGDPGQLLQEVRDREAQRRAEQQREGGADPSVEKDWR